VLGDKEGSMIDLVNALIVIAGMAAVVFTAAGNGGGK